MFFDEFGTIFSRKALHLLTQLMIFVGRVEEVQREQYCCRDEDDLPSILSHVQASVGIGKLTGVCRAQQFKNYQI